LFIDVIILLVGLAVKKQTKSLLNCCFPCKDGHFNEKIKTLGVEFGCLCVVRARDIVEKSSQPANLMFWQVAAKCGGCRETSFKSVITEQKTSLSSILFSP
jgi:hypothetical protein